MTPRTGFGLALALSAFMPLCASAQNSETIDFTADVTAAQGVDAGSIITGSILYAPSNVTILPDVNSTTDYLTLQPSVFSFASNGALSDSAPLYSVVSQLPSGAAQPGSLSFGASGASSALLLNFNGLLNTSNQQQGAPGSPVFLSDWQSASFTYEAITSQGAFEQVSADVTSVKVVRTAAPEVNLSAAPGALVLLTGLVAVIGGRRRIDSRSV